MIRRKAIKKSFYSMAGLTLLETMFAMTIGSIIVIGVIIFYGVVRQNANINKVVKDLNTIAGQTQTYMTAGGVGDLSASGANTVSVLQNTGYLPSPMSDPWGNQYTGILTLGNNTTGSTTTTITVVSLGSPTGETPDKNCRAIGQALTGVATAGTTGCSFVFPL